MKTLMKTTLLKIIDICETFQNADIEGHTEESVIADAERTIKLIIRIASDGLKDDPEKMSPDELSEFAAKESLDHSKPINPDRNAGWDCSQGYARKCDMNCRYPIYGCAKRREYGPLTEPEKAKPRAG